MKKNMGTADRLIRLLVGIILGALGVSNVTHGTLEIVLVIVAIVLVVTSAFGVCPAYVPIKLSTCKKGEVK